jgi:hypothetical protein
MSPQPCRMLDREIPLVLAFDHHQRARPDIIEAMAERFVEPGQFAQAGAGHQRVVAWGLGRKRYRAGIDAGSLSREFAALEQDRPQTGPRRIVSCRAADDAAADDAKIE